MKRFLLLSAAALATTSLFAQYPQSPYENSQCKLDSAIMLMYSEGMSWGHKLAMNYDANGFLIILETYGGGSADGGWILRHRDRYENTAAGLPVVIYSESLEEGWVVDGKTTMDYDAQGNCILSRTYGYDRDTQDFYLNQAMEYAYDSQNRLVQQDNIYYVDGAIYSIYRSVYEYCEWGVSKETKTYSTWGTWQDGSKTTYSYNEQGQLVESLTGSMGNDGVWYDEIKDVYGYDEAGRVSSYDLYQYVISSETGLPGFTLNQHLEPKYDAAGLQTELLYYDGDYVMNEYMTYAYDEHGAMTNERMYIQDYDWETGVSLGFALHENSDFFYHGHSSNLVGVRAEAAQSHGCKLVGGKLVIVNGNDCYDLQGRRVK